MKLLYRMKSLFLGRMEPAFYRENRNELRATNYGLLRRACLFSAGMCLFLFVLTLVNSLISELALFYLGYTLFYAAMTVLVLTVVRHKHQMIPVFYYLFAVSIFVLVIDVGTRRTPDLPAVTFYVFLMIIPLLYVTRPVFAAAMTVTACVAFCIVTAKVKGAGSFLAQTDILNAVCCGIVGVGVDVTIGNLQLENIRAKVYFKRQSATDELTGLPNRRRFDLLLEKRFLECMVAKESLTVFMMDIDDFKSYNDTYGHVQGDECLRQVSAALLRAAKVHGVFLARYGGEEFVAVVTQRGDEELRRIGRRFVDCVSELDMRHEKSARGRITISVGYAESKAGGANSTTALLQQADEALYAAKAEGKNRVKFWTAELSDR